MKFTTSSVLELFNKTIGADFNSIVGEIILSELVLTKVAHVKELGHCHERCPVRKGVL